MTTVQLLPRLAEQLEQEAKRRTQSVDALVNDWLEEQLWRAHHKKIQEEATFFQAQHAELLARYGNGYIAMHDGHVVDYDTDMYQLHERIRTAYGDEPILITPLTAEPVQTLRVLGARHMAVLS